MDLQDFISRWSASGVAERANKDAFLLDLCAVPLAKETAGALAWTAEGAAAQRYNKRGANVGPPDLQGGSEIPVMFSFLGRQREARLEEQLQSQLASRERAAILSLGPKAARPLAGIAVKYGRASSAPFRYEFLFDVLLEVVRNCPESDTQAVFRALRYGLRNSRGSYRHQFIKLLGVLGLKRGIKLLAREARDGHYRSSALDALGMISSEGSVRILEQYLKHRELSARSAALRGIARIGQPGAESVISAIRDPDLQSVRTWALDYLSRKRAVSEISNLKAQSGPAIVPLLVERLRGTKDQFLRVAIIQALAEARDPQAIPALVRLDGLLARSYPLSDFAELGVTSLKAALANALVSIADFSQATEGDLRLLAKVPDDIKTERKRFGDNEYECLHKDGHSWEEDVTTVIKSYDDLREMAACELRRRGLGNTLHPPVAKTILIKIRKKPSPVQFDPHSGSASGSHSW